MTGSLHISKHPLVATKLSQLREANQTSKVTRELVNDLASMLSYEATIDIPITHEKTVSYMNIYVSIKVDIFLEEF